MSAISTSTPTQLSNTQITQLNDFIDTATDQIMCNTECQHERTKEQLKQKYLDAKTAFAQGSSQINQSFKNYYVYVEGDEKYNEYEEKQLSVESDKIINIYKKRIFKEIEDLQRHISSINELTINSDIINSRATELYNNNQIIKLNKLPNSLDYLSCHNNQIIELNYLPNSLRTLLCYNNPFYYNFKPTRENINKVNKFRFNFYKYKFCNKIERYYLKYRTNKFKEELIKVVMHPNKIQRILDITNCDIDELENYM